MQGNYLSMYSKIATIISSSFLGAGLVTYQKGGSLKKMHDH